MGCKLRAAPHAADAHPVQPTVADDSGLRWRWFRTVTLRSAEGRTKRYGANIRWDALVLKLRSRSTGCERRRPGYQVVPRNLAGRSPGYQADPRNPIGLVPGLRAPV